MDLPEKQMLLPALFLVHAMWVLQLEFYCPLHIVCICFWDDSLSEEQLIASLHCCVFFLLNSMTPSAHIGVCTGEVPRNSPPDICYSQALIWLRNSRLPPAQTTWLFRRQSTSRNQDGSCRPSRYSLHCHGFLWSAEHGLCSWKPALQLSRIRL